MIKFTLKWICAWFLFIALILTAGSMNDARYIHAVETHIVKPGETLWSISCDIYDKGVHRDVREIMFDISTDNYISNGEIFPGQILRIHYFKLRK